MTRSILWAFPIENRDVTASPLTKLMPTTASHVTLCMTLSAGVSSKVVMYILIVVPAFLQAQLRQVPVTCLLVAILWRLVLRTCLSHRDLSSRVPADQASTGPVKSCGLSGPSRITRVVFGGCGSPCCMRCHANTKFRQRYLQDVYETVRCRRGPTAFWSRPLSTFSAYPYQIVSPLVGNLCAEVPRCTRPDLSPTVHAAEDDRDRRMNF